MKCCGTSAQEGTPVSINYHILGWIKGKNLFLIFPLLDGGNHFMSHLLCAEIPPCAVDPLYRCFLSVLLFSPTPLVDSRPPSSPSISIGISLCVCCCSGRNAGGLVFPLSRSGWGSSAGVFFEFKSPFVSSCRAWGSVLRTRLNQLNGYRGCRGKDPSIQRSDMFKRLFREQHGEIESIFKILCCY